MISGPFTITLVLITVLVSIGGFNDGRIIDNLILWPRRMQGGKEPYRLLTSGFIHADSMHLAFNMFTLFFIGAVVERLFRLPWLYMLLYLTGIVAASLPSFYKNRHNPTYRSLGASGGVAAVLFSLVFFRPWEKLYIFGAIGIPSILFAVLYLAYSAYMSRHGRDNTNHDAHFWGSLYGFLFTLIADPAHGQTFLNEIVHPVF